MVEKINPNIESIATLEPGVTLKPGVIPESRVIVKYKLDKGASPPFQATDGSAGFDIALLEDVHINPSSVISNKLHVGVTLINTGLYLEIPKGYVGKLYVRSSIGIRKGLALANGTGIIDSDYRGEVIVAIRSFNAESFILKKGERIAQLLIEKAEPVGFVEVDELEDTKRGEGGIGSTGA